VLPGDLDRPECRQPISLPRVLLVEGYDAFRVFLAFLRHLDLASIIEVRNPGGNTQFDDYFEALTVTPGFSDVVSLGIIRDAETSASAAFKAVCEMLRRHNRADPMTSLPVPVAPAVLAEGRPNVAVYILPDCEHEGALETLLLKAIADDLAIACMDKYFTCLSAAGLGSAWNTNRRHKAQLQAFRASRERPGLKLGEAADKGYYPWDSPAFDGINQFLRQL
jgi:hypothetical protein